MDIVGERIVEEEELEIGEVVWMAVIYKNIIKIKYWFIPALKIINKRKFMI